MLAATAMPARRAGFDLRQYRHTVVIASGGREHVALEIAGRLYRLDIVRGTLLHGPASLRIHLKFAPNIVPKLAALDGLLRTGGIRDPLRRAVPRDGRLPRLAQALEILDALKSRMSQFEIAAALLGDDRATDWPGANDHLKSWVRRRIALARRMNVAGPRGVMAGKV